MSYKKKVVDHLGDEFETIKDLAKFHGKTTNSIYQKLQRGYTIKEALTGRFKAKDHLGNSYKNLTQMAKAYGLPIYLLSKRLDAGYTIEEALTLPKHNARSISIKIKDKVYTSISEAVKDLGISLGAVYYRIEKGYTRKHAILEVLANKKK